MIKEAEVLLRKDDKPKIKKAKKRSYFGNRTAPTANTTVLSPEVIRAKADAAVQTGSSFDRRRNWNSGEEVKRLESSRSCATGLDMDKLLVAAATHPEVVNNPVSDRLNPFSSVYSKLRGLF